MADPPGPGPVARAVFGGRMATAARYLQDLASTGVEHGVIGPREVPRLWDRHLVNSAVVAVLIPRGSKVCDVGSGAGLPGVAIAIARPDLRVTVVEPLARRTAYLNRLIAELGLSSVDVVRGRVDGRGPVVIDANGGEHVVAAFDVVTARAVAGLDRLLPWLLPLARTGGTVLALKGRTAEAELAAVEPFLQRRGATGQLVELGGAEVSGRSGEGGAPTAGAEPTRDADVVRVVRVDVGSADNNVGGLDRHARHRGDAGSRGTARNRTTGQKGRA